MRKRERLWLFCVLLIFIFVVCFLIDLLRKDRAVWLLKFLRWSHVELAHVPEPFSVTHLILLFITSVLAGTVLKLSCRLSLGWIRRKTDRLVFASGLAFAGMELYKQLYCFYVLGSGSYDFSLFPFQFCSLPIYLCLLLPLLPSGALKDAGYRFLALFGTVGGLLVILYPRLSDFLYLCAHTVVWHILMVLLGAYLLIACDCGRSFKRDVLPTVGIFLSAVSVATLLNVIFSDVEGFQMFYMSPYHHTTFLFLDWVQARLGWWISMLIYVLAFVFLAAIPLWWLGKFFLKRKEKGIRRLKNKKTEKNF